MRHPDKTWWNSIKEDITTFDLAREDTGDSKIEDENQSATGTGSYRSLVNGCLKKRPLKHCMGSGAV